MSKPSGTLHPQRPDNLTLLQRAVPNQLRGRALGLVQTVGTTAAISGSLALPVLAEGRRSGADRSCGLPSAPSFMTCPRETGVEARDASAAPLVKCRQPDSACVGGTADRRLGSVDTGSYRESSPVQLERERR